MMKIKIIKKEIKLTALDILGFIFVISVNFVLYLNITGQNIPNLLLHGNTCLLILILHLVQEKNIDRRNVNEKEKR